MSLFIFALGAAIGSFLNLCIHRIPRKESLVHPASHCDECRAPLRWMELVPIVSFVWLRGKCRHCGARIPIYHLVVELLTAIAFLMLWGSHGLSWEFVSAAVLCSLLLIISFIDFHHLFIPNGLVVVGIAAGFTGRFVLDGESLSATIVDGGVATAMLGIPGILGSFWYRRQSMGMGDIKLAGMLGVALGWQAALPVIYLGCLLAAVYGVAGIYGRGFTRFEKIPLGFFAGLVAAVYLVLQTHLAGASQVFP